MNFKTLIHAFDLIHDLQIQSYLLKWYCSWETLGAIEFLFIYQVRSVGNYVRVL